MMKSQKLYKRLMHINQKFDKKIFHGIVNYGTQAGILSKTLREIYNVEAFSVAMGDKYKRQIDRELLHGGSIPEFFFKHLFNILFLIRCFFKYDIFHFYFGTTLLPKQLDLPFYKLFNKKVVMHYLGNDVELYQWSIDNYDTTNMSHMMTDAAGVKHDKKVLKRMSFESKYVNHKIVCAPQYSPFVSNSEFIPLAIDLSIFKFNEPIPFEDCLRVQHSPTSRLKKGTKYLIEAINKLKSEGYDIQLDLCENISHDELKERYKNCHLSVTALLGGWYGTSGVEAMATGRPIVSFLRDSLFEYTDLEKDSTPIISANKDTIYETLKAILEKKYDLNDLSYKSYSFVQNMHDPKIVTGKILNIYKNLYD